MLPPNQRCEDVQTKNDERSANQHFGQAINSVRKRQAKQDYRRTKRGDGDCVSERIEQSQPHGASR